MRSKKIAASILAFSLITSAAASDTGIISKLIPVNNISASAASATISSGDWKFVITEDNTAEIKEYTGSDTDINIPDEITDNETNQTFTVTAISGSAFKHCKDQITSVHFPSGINCIESNILSGATNLTDVDIPDGVTFIGNFAFAYTPNLKSITLPDTLGHISLHTFRESGLTSITFPSSLKSIDPFAFSGSKLTTVTLPSTLEYIGYNAFENCQDLQSATIKCNCDMGNYVFKDSNNLTNINISTDCLDAVFNRGVLGECPNLKTINNVQIVRKDANGRPYLYSKSIPYIKKNFAVSDKCGVSFMNEYIDAMVKYVVKTETAGCTNDYQKVKKLHDWVCNKVDYAYLENWTPDPSDECHVDSSVFVRNTTVCDGYARALTLLLQEAGFEAYYLENLTHAWTMVRIDDNYFHVDACHDDGGGYDHYLKSDYDIKKCSAGHESWSINKPTFRYNYKGYCNLPVCQYSYSDINRGDVNLDGEINQSDVDLLQKYIIKAESIPDKEIADVNRDGEINIMDVVEIARKIQ